MEQTKRWIFLVDDPQGSFAPTASSEWRDASSSTSPLITSLPNPKNGLKRRYMVSGGRLLEIQRVASATPASWFVDQSVKSDGSLLVASPVDPVFLLLPALERNATRFSDLHQHAHTDDAGTDLSAVLGIRGVYDGIDCVCDSMEGMTDGKENRLYRLNREKTISWLQSKTSRLATVLQNRSDAAIAKARSTFASFSTTSTAVAPSGAASSSSSASASDGDAGTAGGAGAAPQPVVKVEAAQYETALSLLSEYVSDPWIQEVAVKMGMDVVKVLPHLKVAKSLSSAPGAGPSSSSSIASAPTSPASSSSPTDGSAGLATPALNITVDPLADLQRFMPGRGGSGTGSLGGGGTSPTDGGAKKTSPTVAPQTIQQKKLAKTNIKGMSSMASYFGKK